MSPIGGALLNAVPADEPQTGRSRANAAEPDDDFGQAFSAVTTVQSPNQATPVDKSGKGTPAHDASSCTDTATHNTGPGSPAAARTTSDATTDPGDRDAPGSSGPGPDTPGSSPSASSAASTQGGDGATAVPGIGATGLSSQAGPSAESTAALASVLSSGDGPPNSALSAVAQDATTASAPTQTPGTTAKSPGATGATPASGPPGSASPSAVPMAGSAASAGVVLNASAVGNAGAVPSTNPVPTKSNAAGAGSGQPMSDEGAPGEPSPDGAAMPGGAGRATVLTSVIGHSSDSGDPTAAHGDTHASPSSVGGTGGAGDAGDGGHSTPVPGSPAAPGATAQAGSVPVAPQVAAGTPPAPSAPGGSGSPPPTPAQQIVTVLSPLRSSDDGTHEVTIGLEPEGLGTVKATITVNADQVVVQLGADNDQARDALRQALPLLRHELGGDGSTATVLLSDGRSHGQQAHPQRAGGPHDATRDEADDDDRRVDPMSAAESQSGHIDLHL